MFWKKNLDLYEIRIYDFDLFDNFNVYMLELTWHAPFARYSASFNLRIV